MYFEGYPIGDPTFVEPSSSWNRHGPFGMWLVHALRPNSLVELGTHSGYSYFCFCQAVLEAGLDTCCFAVDTWQGDEHAGFYEETVYRQVQERNEPYSRFSTLLRKTFVDALDDIEDGTVDLLHIDGRHFYEDVKEDFESWIPKLSRRSVVLFHDTHVRERGFGVWRYWEEIKNLRPSINFPHQHGLGVLFWGDDIAPGVRSFVAMLKDPAQLKRIYDKFAKAGEDTASTTVRNLRERVREAEARAESLEVNLRNCESRLAEVNARQHTELMQLQALGRNSDTLNIELALCRRRPLRNLGKYLHFKLLIGLSSSHTPFPQRMKARFRRSAEKRDPKRSLLSISRTEELQPAISSRSISYSGKVAINETLPHILVVSHDTSRTGAPILALNLVRELSERYNVTTLCLRGGELVENFCSYSVEVWVADQPTGSTSYFTKLLEEISNTAQFVFAIVNSIVSRDVLGALRAKRIPNVALVHEFASYTLPKTSFHDVFRTADRVVFSTDLTLRSALQATGQRRTPGIHVLPQGKCTVPMSDISDKRREAERKRLTSILRPKDQPDRFLVIGAGHVQYRKGVDIFIETARRVQSQPGAQHACFVWIGAGYLPEKDTFYSIYLKDQIERAGLEGRVMIIPDTTEIEYVYGLADLFLLSSRLDPLPNVAIDAMSQSMSVVRFFGTTGCLS